MGLFDGLRIGPGQKGGIGLYYLWFGFGLVCGNTLGPFGISSENNRD